jgi:hypothetical protein
MLDLAPRRDLSSLSDSELAERFDAALDAYEALKERYGFLFSFYALSWTPRTLVKDPHKYMYPSHVRSEIRDIENEMERRVASRRPPLRLPG